jgi:hypothetical protein
VVTIDKPPEGATPLELIHWAIDKRGLPAALKQMTNMELRTCLIMYHLVQARKHEREKVRALTRRIKVARKLQPLLPYRLPDLDAIIALDEWLLNPKGDPPIEGLPRSAAAAISIMSTKARDKKLNDKYEVDQLSAFEVVAGSIIPIIWETHCGSAAGYTRDGADNSIRGEFIDFAEYVLAVLGITKSGGAPYERRSIEAALTKWRRLLPNQ